MSAVPPPSNEQPRVVSVADAIKVIHPLVQTILNPLPRYFDFRPENQDPHMSKKMMGMSKKIGNMCRDALDRNRLGPGDYYAGQCGYFRQVEEFVPYDPEDIPNVEFVPYDPAWFPGQAQHVVLPDEDVRIGVLAHDFLAIRGDFQLPENVKAEVLREMQAVDWVALEAEGNGGGQLSEESVEGLLRCLQVLAAAAPGLEDLPAAKIKGPDYGSPTTKSKKNKKFTLRSLVNLWISIKIHEDYAARAESSDAAASPNLLFVKNDEVDAATASIFTCRPDLPLIRRELIGCGFLRELSSVEIMTHGYTGRMALDIAKVSAFWEEVVRG